MIALNNLPLVVGAVDVLAATSRAASEIAARIPQLNAPKPDPAAPLPTDFQLTPVMTGLLAQPLSLAGFQLEPKPRKFLKTTIVHSLAKNGGNEVSLLALSSDLAKKPPESILLPFSALEHFFDAGSRLCFLAENVDLPNKSLRDIMEKIWMSNPARNLRPKWLPWLDITDLQNAGGDNDTVSALCDLIGVGPSGPDTSPPPKSELVPQDKMALIGVLTRSDEFDTVDHRQTLLGVAGLGDFADLPEGTAREVAGRLLLNMERKGGTPHPLALLVNYLLSGQLNGDDTKILNNLIQRNAFLKL